MKNKWVALFFAFPFLLGGCGAHKFYLGQVGDGIIRVFLSWTLIPTAIAFFEFLWLLFVSQAEFDLRFNPSKEPLPSNLSENTRVLADLQALYDQQIITAEEYEEKRQAILKQIGKVDHKSSYVTPNKIDINTCSKDDLVKGLGLSIVYANDIIALRESGHIFTYPEELTEIIGIPETTTNKIKSKLIFTYDARQESFTSWRRANSFSVQELVAVGLELRVAEKLVAVRTTGGSYRSIVDITKRTGLPIESFRVLV